MSNVPLDEFQPVPGETRYRKYFRKSGLRIRMIFLNNYLPGHYYWDNEQN